MNYNKIMIGGRITADPELKTTPSGKFVSSISIAVDRKFSKDDQKKECDFIPCVFWGKKAEVLCKYFHKGSGIFVCGSLMSRKYADKNGENRTVWEVLADEIEFIDAKKASETPQSNAATDSVPSYNQSSEGFAELSSEDDLPF